MPQVVLQLRVVQAPQVVLQLPVAQALLVAALQVALAPPVAVLQVAQALLVAALQLALAARLLQAPAPLPPDLPALGQPDSFLPQEELVLAAEIARARSVQTRVRIDRWQVVFS